MAGTFKFELVSPERILISGDAEAVALPGIEGDMTIFAGHAPLVSTLRPGIIDVSTGGTKNRIFVKSGFVEIGPDRVTVLAEKAFDTAELASDWMDGELTIAEADLAAAKDDNSRMLAERAIEQLKALGGKVA